MVPSQRWREIETYDATREAADVDDVVDVGGDGGGERTREDGGARKSWSGCGLDETGWMGSSVAYVAREFGRAGFARE